MKHKKLLFIQLNEINFEYIDKYIENYNLEHLRKIKSDGLIETSSESEYEHLEPWIQWASVTTGKSLEDHKIFRLGDIINYGHDQIYEKVERMNFKVGAICPMNVDNRLRDPSYFIPDPWTNTNSDNSFWSKNISKTLSQVVNDNSKNKVSLKSLFFLGLSILKFMKLKNIFKATYYLVSGFNKKWRRAIFLDLLLHDIHTSLISSKNPNFSTIFFNALAHIQHHYFYNSQAIKSNFKNPKWYIQEKYDPLGEVLIVYDKILGDYLNMKEYDLIIATGLRQIPYEKVKFDYRLKDHEKFLDILKIPYVNVEPRMTGDFLISFDNTSDALNAFEVLANLRTNDKQNIFEKIDNRGKSIFLTLTYDKEINDSVYVFFQNQKFLLEKYTAFVGIKNGKHDGKGYSYFKGKVKDFSLKKDDHVKNLFYSINDYFVN